MVGFKIVLCAIIVAGVNAGGIQSIYLKENEKIKMVKNCVRLNNQFI